ncbi:polygalacturonase ADPG1-like [Ananas comosus]|uniref:Polygalacturonase ADPG1-like n=1 Tax=Ananas comosus TaxID=4615 RepID=A0A6P5GQ33_ANACO|nr:polygalacturonase ADPG1-like [Ananas comosus]
MHSLVFLVGASLTLAGRLVTATQNVMDYGAKGDGTSDDTCAFLHAWHAACADSSSPTVLVPSGSTFMLKQLNFEGPCKSNIHFQECSSLNDCSNVQLSNLKFINSPRMHVSIYQTVGAQIRGLTITSPEFSPNTDGLHVEKSQHVEILDSIIGTGDDCVSIGTDTYDINVTRITCGPGHGIRSIFLKLHFVLENNIGSLGKDDSEAIVEQINVSYCKFAGTTNGVRIKTWQGGSGYAKEITFSHITLYSVEKPIVIDQYYCVGDHNNCKNKTSAVQVCDVHYSEVKGTSSSGIAISLACSETTPCAGITMENINIQSTNQGEDETTTCYNAQVNKKGYVVPSISCPT